MFRQICSDAETIFSASWMTWGWVNFLQIFIFVWTIMLHSSNYIEKHEFSHIADQITHAVFVKIIKFLMKLCSLNAVFPHAVSTRCSTAFTLSAPHRRTWLLKKEVLDQISPNQNAAPRTQIHRAWCPKNPPHLHTHKLWMISPCCSLASSMTRHTWDAQPKRLFSRLCAAKERTIYIYEKILGLNLTWWWI